MDHRAIHSGNQKRRAGAWMRGMSLFCVIVLALTCLVGCDTLVFADEMAALRAELEEKIDLLEKNYAAALDKITTLTDNDKENEETIAALLAANQQMQTQIAGQQAVIESDAKALGTPSIARGSGAMAATQPENERYSTTA